MSCAPPQATACEPAGTGRSGKGTGGISAFRLPAGPAGRDSARLGLPSRSAGFHGGRQLLPQPGRGNGGRRRGWPGASWRGAGSRSCWSSPARSPASPCSTWRWFAAALRLVAGGRFLVLGIGAGLAEYGAVPRHSPGLPGRPGRHGQQGRHLVRLGLPGGHPAGGRHLLRLHRPHHPALHGGGARRLRGDLRRGATTPLPPEGTAAHPAPGTQGFPQPGRGAVRPAALLPVRQRMVHRRLAAAVPDPPRGPEPRGGASDPGSLLARS